MWCLEEDDRVSGRPQLGEPRFSVFRPNWWKSHERECLAANSGRGEGRDGGTRTWNRLDAHPVLNRRADESQPRIGDRRRARVRHEGDILSALESLDDCGDLP